MTKKKLLSILLVVVLVVACGIVAVAALADESVMEAASFPCCSRYRGTATRVLHHNNYGDGCEAEVETYCPECGTVFDHYTGIWSICPHPGY